MPHKASLTELSTIQSSIPGNLCETEKSNMRIQNANYLRPATGGIVTATATPYHLGKRTQVWHIDIHNEEQKLICVARMTMAVIARN